MSQKNRTSFVNDPIDNLFVERSGFTYTSGRGHNPFDHEIFIGSHQFLVKAGAVRRSQEVSSSRM